jgi:hypothetical protein
VQDTVGGVVRVRGRTAGGTSPRGRQ